jgi:peptide/nickel transport system permease protein
MDVKSVVATQEPGTGGALGLELGPRQSRRTSFWRRYIRHRLALGGMIFVLAIGLAALLAPWLSPYDPNTMQLPESRQEPSLRHPLGTDALGRDHVTRALYGGRVSITVALLAVAISSTIGTVLGTISGFSGGWVDSIIMRLTDVFLSFPLLLLLIVLMTILEPSATNVVVIIGFFTWMGTARIVRGQVLSVKNEQYVEAAVAGGAGSARIVMRHVLPNSIAPLIVVSTLGVADADRSVAELSRARHPAADSLLGQHAQRGSAASGAGAGTLGLDRPGRRDHPDRAERQFHGRRAARRPRSTPPAATILGPAGGST